MESIHNILFRDVVTEVGAPIIKGMYVLDEQGCRWNVFCHITPLSVKSSSKRYYKITSPTGIPYWTFTCEYPELYPLISYGTNGLTDTVSLNDMHQILKVLSRATIPSQTKGVGRIVRSLLGLR